MVANTYLEGTYSEMYPEVIAGRGRAAAAVPAVLVSRRHSEPRRAGDARLDPRGRRARLLAGPRVRRGVRQSGPDRGLRGRRRRGRDRAAGHGVALEQVPQSGHRRRGAADPAPERLQDRQPDRAGADQPARSSRACSSATGTARTSSKATSRRRCTRRWRRRWTTSSRRSARSRRRARSTGQAGAPALADDHPAHAQGMDRAEGGGRQEDRGILALAPGAARGAGRRSPSICRQLEQWMRSYRPEELFDERGPLRAGAGGAGARAATGAWAPIRTPTAACCSRISRLPDFRATTPSTSPSPGRVVAEATRVLGQFPARRDAAQSRAAELPGVRARRDRLQPPGRAVRGRPTGPGWPSGSPDDEHLSPDGRVMEILSEHTCQGWLEGYLLTGRHGFFSCYEAFIHIVDSMFNQHAKWLKVTRADSVARAHRVAQLPADVARLAAGPQRVLAPGPGVHRSRRQQEGGRDPRLSAAGREHAALGRGSLPAEPQLRQRDRGRQAAGRSSTSTWTPRVEPLRRRHRHLGVGEQRPGRRARRGHGVRGRRADARDPGGGQPPARACCPELQVRVVNVVDLMRLQPREEHPHGLSDRDVRRALHARTSRSSSRTTATHG